MIANSSNSTSKVIKKGLQTRNQILNKSVDIASAEGLEGLTIGRLSKDLKMSKSGLFAHFGSKEDLQIETVRRARDVFIESIVTPANGEKPGLRKLLALLDNWIEYVSKSVFRGGCFFFAVSAEMDDRPGRVRDLIAHLTLSWLKVIEEQIAKAVELGEISPQTDVEFIAFRFHGYVQEANWYYRLHGREVAFEYARKSVLNDLELCVTNKEDFEELRWTDKNY